MKARHWAKGGEYVQALEAVFENGTFRLLEKPAVSLRDGQHVRLMVEAEATPQDALELAEHVYDSRFDEEVDDIERSALNHRGFLVIMRHDDAGCTGHRYSIGRIATEHRGFRQSERIPPCPPTRFSFSAITRY